MLLAQSTGISLLSFRIFFATQFTNNMFDSHHGMVKYHPRSTITHHLSNLFTHIRLVAMHRTAVASWLCLSKTAMVQTKHSIIEQCLTIRAKSAAALMLLATIQTYHRFNGMFLVCYTIHLLSSKVISIYDRLPVMYSA